MGSNKKEEFLERLKSANKVREYRKIFEDMILKKVDVDKFIIQSLSPNLINDREKYNQIKSVWLNLKKTIKYSSNYVSSNKSNKNGRKKSYDSNIIQEFEKKSFKEKMQTLLQMKMKNKDIRYLIRDMIRKEKVENALKLELIKLSMDSEKIITKRIEINKMDVNERIREITMNSCLIFYIDNPTKMEVDLALEINPSLSKHYFEGYHYIYDERTKEMVVNDQLENEVDSEKSLINSYEVKNRVIEENKINKESLNAEQKEVVKENTKEEKEVIKNVNKKYIVINRIKRNKKISLNVDWNVTPARKSVAINKVIRNYSVVKYLKDLYKNRCQVCGTRLEIGLGRFYSEVHHIRPLGKHAGSDTINNAIVLCPNCHTLFDRGSIMIDQTKMEIRTINNDNDLNGKKVEFKHNIDIDNLIYHNRYIYVLDYTCANINNIEVEKVDYEDTVIIYDDIDKNTLSIKINAFWQGNQMPLIQERLLNKKIGDEIDVNGYRYKIIEIEKYKS